MDILDQYKQHYQPALHDFEILLSYVRAHKPALTPVQGLVPVKHILKMMESFLVKETSEEKVGVKIFRKRFEDEFPRFYFMDLLAVNAKILSVRRNKLATGKYFKKYFEMPPFLRPVGLFFNFCFDFNHGAWFAGGDFGLTVMLKAPFIWDRILSWRKEKEILWEEWAKRVIKECALTWTAEKQDFSESSMIWGLKSCFIDPLGYLGVVEQIKKEGKYGSELHAVRLTPWGQVCLKQLEEMLTKRSSQKSDFFSLN